MHASLRQSLLQLVRRNGSVAIFVHETEPLQIMIELVAPWRGLAQQRFAKILRDSSAELKNSRSA